MLMSLYYLKTLRWVLPAGFMLGTAPTFFSTAIAWRISTAFLPYQLFEKGDELWYMLYQRLVLFFYENWTGLQMVLYGDFDELAKKKENVIFICNHQSTVDWIIAVMMAERQGMTGCVRYVLKDGLKYFPLYGAYFKQHCCVFVERGGGFREDKAIGMLEKIKSRRIPFWMVLFPEGTRYNVDNVQVISKSENYAVQEGIEPYQYHLTPRLKGFNLCLSHLRDVADACYDITIGFDHTALADGKRQNAAEMTEFLDGMCSELHIHVKRIPIIEIPEDEDQVKNWLYERFREKDRLLAHFFSRDPRVRGTLGEGGVRRKLGWSTTVPAILFWTALHIPIFGSYLGRECYWKLGIFGIALGWGWMAVVDK